MNSLEALEKLKQNNIDGSHLFDGELLDIIETALKDYEMEHTLRIRLENINYDLVREKQENDKKLKALEIIKRCPTEITVLIDTYDDWEEYRNDFKKNERLIKTQTEFELLKEVLL